MINVDNSESTRISALVQLSSQLDKERVLCRHLESENFLTDQPLSEFSQNNGSLLRLKTKCIDLLEHGSWNLIIALLNGGRWVRGMLAYVLGDHSITVQGNLKAWSISHEPIIALSCTCLHHKKKTRKKTCFLCLKQKMLYMKNLEVNKTVLL